jgi:hypothetical protein
MRAIHLRSGLRRNRGDSSLTALVLIACLVCIVIFLKWYLKSPVQDPDLYDYPEAWKEWRAREKIKKPDQPLSAEQPALTELLKYDTTLSDIENKEPRGEMLLFVVPGGGVSGGWHGLYWKTRTVNIQLMKGGFEGKVYPAKIYRNENGEEDPSMLYMMAKGSFTALKTDTKKGRVSHIGGDIYVRGWLNPEYVLTGEVTVTSFGESVEKFTWKSHSPDRQSLFFFKE